MSYFETQNALLIELINYMKPISLPECIFANVIFSQLSKQVIAVQEAAHSKADHIGFLKDTDTSDTNKSSEQLLEVIR